MGKPRLIILIRHAQSEGNKNRDIHQTVPDHRVRLTPEGHQQALEAGRKLRALLRPDDSLHFFTSPYRRTRETTEGILSALTSDDPSPSPFPRNTIKVYEEPRLREQDFGNFQPGSAEMERMWQERADYGHFFYRIPNGESAADAYDRISGFNDSLWRRFEENDFASVCILVTHGLMTRVFLMKWYHFSVEYFEDLRNVNHCEFVVMKKDLDNGKFILQNQLRTWSELKRERAARDSINQANNAAAEPAIGDSPIPQRRRWGGGCPDGCDHSQHNHGARYPQPRRQNTADLFKDDNEILSSSFKDSSRSSSRSNSIKLNQTRSSPRKQHSRDRYPVHNGGKKGDSAASSDLSLPDNEDTILDQDPDKAPTTTQLPFHSSNRTPKNRFRNTQPVSMSVNETLIEEELSPNSQNKGVSTPTPFPAPPFPAGNPSKPPSTTEITPEILSRKLRSPRELALISMAGRDGGGSRSGAGSSDEAEAEAEAEEEQSISQLVHQLGGATDQTEEEEEQEEEIKEQEEDEEEEAFPLPASLSRSATTTATTSSSPPQNPTSTTPTPIKRTPISSSLATALRGEHIPLPPHPASTPTHPPSSSGHGHGHSHSRALADALGDQSDAEVTEDDEDLMGIRTRQRGEEERIWEEERRERVVSEVRTNSGLGIRNGNGGGGARLRREDVSIE